MRIPSINAQSNFRLNASTAAEIQRFRLQLHTHTQGDILLELLYPPQRLIMRVKDQHRKAAQPSLCHLSRLHDWAKELIPQLSFSFFSDLLTVSTQ